MTKNKDNQEEEIDLGNLFNAIGRGIKNFFIGIGKVLSIVFHYVILLLIFFKKHTIKIGLSIVIGAVVGFFLDSIKPAEYSSVLLLETNFGSGSQLYKQINYLDNLVGKKDTISLAKALQLSIHEASLITGFEVNRYRPKRNLYRSFDEYIQTTDTIYTRQFKVEDFKKRLDEYDYRYHEVSVRSISNSIFRKVSIGIKKLVENEYFMIRRDIKQNEIRQKLVVLEKNLSQIDSLRSLYKKVALIEAERQTSGSTIEISQKQVDSKKNDIELFHISNQIMEKIESLNGKIVKSENILNFISDFDEVGVMNRKITNKKYFQVALLFGTITLLIILLVQLNGYLNNYLNK